MCVKRVNKMTKYFGTMQFYKRALLIAVPVMLQQLIQTLVSLVDSFMVSGLGDVRREYCRADSVCVHDFCEYSLYIRGNLHDPVFRSQG